MIKSLTTVSRNLARLSSSASLNAGLRNIRRFFSKQTTKYTVLQECSFTVPIYGVPNSRFLIAEALFEIPCGPCGSHV
jgi:hypothetical protein